MPKKAYIGVDNTARKVKKIYIGVDGTARKVKKAYIGIGGIARLFWAGGGTLAYHGTITALSQYRYELAATSVGNHALFGGGRYSAAISNTVNIIDAYDKSLTRTLPTAINNKRNCLAATTVGEYALFGGGRLYDSMSNAVTGSNSVSAHDTSLTRTTATALGAGRSDLSATTVGNYALFGGGNTWSNNDVSTIYANVDAYDTSLTKTSVTSLSKARTFLAATAVGNYALFGGGFNSSAQTTVDAYDTSLTRTIPTALSQARLYLAATSVGNYALFAGGNNSRYVQSSTVYATVDAYDTSLTRTTPTKLSAARRGLSATTVEEFALFAGGSGGNRGNTQLSTVDAYDASLTRTIPTGLNTARDCMAATAIGDYALFGGGGSGNGKDIVDAYVVS